jgi:hypothetical protein
MASRVASAVASRLASRLVERVLRRFVRKVSGNDIGGLRVQFDNGVLLLREVDLNVEGRRLKLVIPEALLTQSLQLSR